jgi:hypothetical protein
MIFSGRMQQQRLNFADEVNARRPGQVVWTEIGRGLSVDNATDDISPGFCEVVEHLTQRAPGLFKYRLLTEFGRKLNAKAGWVAARCQAGWWTHH